MTKVVVDAAFREKIDGLREPVELCDQSGRTLGYFHPMVENSTPGDSKVRSPFMDEEIERRRQQRTGGPLGEILEDLDRS